MCAGESSDNLKHRTPEGSSKKKRQPKKLPPIENRPYFTFEETVELTGIGESTLYDWARNWNREHKGPEPYRVGNRYYFLKSKVWKWMDEGGSGAA